MQEHGYTPNNLKALMEERKLTIKDTACILKVSPRQVQNWRIDVGGKGHKDMPLHRWIDLLSAKAP